MSQFFNMAFKVSEKQSVVADHTYQEPESVRGTTKLNQAGLKQVNTIHRIVSRYQTNLINKLF